MSLSGNYTRRMNGGMKTFASRGDVCYQGIKDIRPWFPEHLQCHSILA
jgi:hypothetical protein